MQLQPVGRPHLCAGSVTASSRWVTREIFSRVSWSLSAPPEVNMRPRDRILANLEAIYRESYERAKAAGETARMIDLESAYMRDQLMLEILLDVRDLFSAGAAAPDGNALERLDQLRRLVRR